MPLTGRRTWILASALALTGAATVGGARAADDEIAVMRPDALEWGAVPPVLPPGAEAVVLYGNPMEEGTYALRLRTSGAYEVPPHTHTKFENVTVIEGTVHIAHGETMDKSMGDALDAGGFISIPAEHPHYAWMDGPAVIQIDGEGPFDIKYLNPADDPQKTN